MMIVKLSIELDVGQDTTPDKGLEKAEAWANEMGFNEDVPVTYEIIVY